MGLPIMIQHTEAEKNKTHAGDGYVLDMLPLESVIDLTYRSINLPPGASGRGATSVSNCFAFRDGH